MEAREILEDRPSDPSALQYLGWWHLCEEMDAEAAVDYLTRSIESGDELSWILFLWNPKLTVADPTSMESHYLLGRALMEKGHLSKAYEAYQEAVYLENRSNMLWISVGLLFFHIEQPRDCLDSFSHALRLRPSHPLVWRNLGLLVSAPI